jgi:hypothetical protein
MAKLRYSLRTSWPTCCATSPTNLLGSGKTGAHQVVQLVGRRSCRNPTSRHVDMLGSGVVRAQQVGQQVGSAEFVNQQVVQQVRTCWPTSW